MTAALSSTSVSAPGVVHVEFIQVTAETVARLTGTPLYQRLGVQAERVAAITHGTTIHVNGPFLLARLGDPDMFGMMAHELTHVVQAYPHTPQTWLVEGIADYVRYYVLLPQDPGRRFDPASARYDEGYQATAGLLDWVEQQHPGAVREINAVLRRGGDGRVALMRVVGAEPEQVWSAYLASRPAAAGPDGGAAGLS